MRKQVHVIPTATKKKTKKQAKTVCLLSRRLYDMYYAIYIHMSMYANTHMFVCVSDLEIGHIVCARLAGIYDPNI